MIARFPDQRRMSWSLFNVSRLLLVSCNCAVFQPVPVGELNATYSPRPRPVKDSVEIVNFQVGMSVSITRGENLGREGMIVDMNEDTVTVIFTPEIQPVSAQRDLTYSLLSIRFQHIFRRNYVRVQM